MESFRQVIDIGEILNSLWESISRNLHWLPNYHSLPFNTSFGKQGNIAAKCPSRWVKHFETTHIISQSFCRRKSSLNWYCGKVLVSISWAIYAYFHWFQMFLSIPWRVFIQVIEIDGNCLPRWVEHFCPPPLNSNVSLKAVESFLPSYWYDGKVLISVSWAFFVHLHSLPTSLWIPWRVCRHVFHNVAKSSSRGVYHFH